MTCRRAPATLPSFCTLSDQHWRTSVASMQENGSTGHDVDDLTEEAALRRAVDRFDAGVLNLQSGMAAVGECLREERSKLLSLKSALEKERRAFDEERARVQEVATSSGEKVVLNVGGLTYHTTLTTLRNAAEPTLFAAMFSGRHSLVPDKDGSYFIDRDGRHFHDILNFLRDGRFRCSSDNCDFKYLLELRAEAQYYGMTSLIDQIDAMPHSLDTVIRAGSLSAQPWEYGGGPDEIVFSTNAPCQLLGVGLCGTEGSFKVDLDLLQVDEDNFENIIEHCYKDARVFTKAHGRICEMMFAKPLRLEANIVYMLSALIEGDETSRCEDCFQKAACDAGGVVITFLDWESLNGTSMYAGQFHELYIRGTRFLSQT